MRKLSYMLLVISLLPIGCKKEFNLSLDSSNKNMLVVEGRITNLNEDQYVKLSRTMSYLGYGSNPAVENAIVTVTTDGNELRYTQVSPGYYRAPKGFVGRVGATYNLKIAVDGQIFTASTTMLPPQVVDTLRARRYETGPDLFAVDISFTENPEPNDYFYLSLKVNGVLRNSLFKWYAYSDKLINGLHFDSFFAFDNISGSVGDSVVVFVNSIDKQYYSYIIAGQKSQSEPLPYMAPLSSNMEGNISNGALGFFQASAVTSTCTLLKY